MQNSQHFDSPILIVEITSVATHVLTADFVFDKFSLDTSQLKIEALNEIKSLSIHAEDPRNEGGDVLVFESILKYKLNVNSQAYKHYVATWDAAGPLGQDRMRVIKKAHQQLSINLIKYLKWRKGIPLNYTTIEKINTTLRWEIEGSPEDCSEKLTLPATPVLVFGQHFYARSSKIQVAQDDFADFYLLHSQGDFIPLHHELLIEVEKLLMGSYSRSAYLMLYIALEVSTKSLIRVRKPDATWLIDNTPSPNLHKMYSEFINKEIAQVISNEDLEKLKDITSKRNRVAHKGEDVKTETLDKHFDLIKAWIKAIDYELGYEWAKE